MRYLLILLFINIAYAQDITEINCFNSSPIGYELNIDIDKFESLPPQSEIALSKYNNQLGKKNATKSLISLETDPPQMAYKFRFFDNQLFDYLRVNLTSESALLTYIRPKYGVVLVNFSKCEFEYAR